MIIAASMKANNSTVAEVSLKFREYLEKVNLTEEAKVRTQQLLNELALIELIATTAAPQNREVIEVQLREVEKALESRMKGQGWMTYFSRSSEVVSLGEVWKAIGEFRGDVRERLIADMWSLKQQNPSP